MADTFNFINNMKNYIFVILLFISMLGISYFIATYDYVIKLNKNTSSPVEEMYHRQLVITLDSILDARFSTDYYKEVIDSNDVTTTHTQFSDILSPID